MIAIIVLKIFAASSQHLVEYKEITQCKIEKIAHRKPVTAPEVIPSLSSDGLSLIFRTAKKETEFVVVAGPVFNPIYDSIASKIYWITHHEVCEINIKTQKARTVYRENAISAIGRIWMSGRSLIIRGGKRDSCIKVDFKKNRVIRSLVSCPSP